MRGDYVSMAITYAAHRGFLDVITYLVTRDEVNLNLKNIYDETALTGAVSGRQIETVKYLVGLPGIDVNATGPDGNSPFLVASVVGDLAISQFLAQVPGVNIAQRNTVGATALKLARNHKHADIIQFLESINVPE
jgi:ankyrin repeat protein